MVYMKKLSNQQKGMAAGIGLIAVLAVGIFSFNYNSAGIGSTEESTEADTQTELAEEPTEKTFSAEELAWIESEAERLLAADAARESSLAEEEARSVSVAALIAQTEATTKDAAGAGTQSFNTETAGDTVTVSEIETTTYTEKVVPKEDPTVQTNGDYSGIIQNPSSAASGNAYSEPITTTEPETSMEETTTSEQNEPENTTSSNVVEPESTTVVLAEQDTTPGNVTSWDAFWANAEEYDVSTNKSIPAHFDLTGEHTGY